MINISKERLLKWEYVRFKHSGETKYWTWIVVSVEDNRRATGLMTFITIATHKTARTKFKSRSFHYSNIELHDYLAFLLDGLNPYNIPHIFRG